MKSVVIADDHAVIREGVRRILLQSDRYIVKKEVASIPELRMILSNLEQTDALILDLSIPGGGGLEALKDIREIYPKLPVLIFSMHSEDQFALRAFRAGASGYLSKECASEQLVRALDAITTAQRFFTKATADLICDELESKSACKQSPHVELSDRELFVFTLLGQGKSLTQIARDLSLSIKTISTYRQRALKKMKMTNNAQIVRYTDFHELVVAMASKGTLCN
jgi:two-component system invasion response regulator UvrY